MRCARSSSAPGVLPTLVVIIGGIDPRALIHVMAAIAASPVAAEWLTDTTFGGTADGARCSRPLFAGAQGEHADAGSHVQARDAFDADGLQGDRFLAAAEQRIGADAESGRRVRAGTGIVAGESAASNIRRRRDSPLHRRHVLARPGGGAGAVALHQAALQLRRLRHRRVLLPGRAALPPRPAAGKETNWIQTVPKKGWFAILRLYGPLDAWFDRNWRPDEIEEVK